MKVKSESEVAQSCPTFSDPMDCSPPGSSVHGIFQARVLEWVAIAFSETKGYHPPNYQLVLYNAYLIHILHVLWALAFPKYKKLKCFGR